MTPDELQQYNLNYAQRIREILTLLFKGSENRIKLKIQELYSIVSEGNLIKIEDFRRRLRDIQFMYLEMEDIFKEFATTQGYQQLITQYGNGVDLAYTALTDSNIPIDIRTSFDPKTLNVFVKDMIKDFTVAASGTRQLIGSFYTFSKQGVDTESELTLAVAQAMTETGYRRDATKGIRKLLQSKALEGTTAYVPPEKAAELTERAVNRYIRQQAKKGRIVKQAEITKYTKKVQNDGFIRIINKNGDPMYFRTSVYSDYVTNTRLADSQVIGSIEQGLDAGVRLFQITAHNSPNFCGAFENSLVSDDERLIGTRYYHPGSSKKWVPNSRGWREILPLTRENRPTYHINCKHRIFPVVVTSRTLEKFKISKSLDTTREERLITA